MARPHVASFLHEGTKTISHIVWDGATKRAAIIDSVLDYNPVNGAFTTHSADKLVAHAREHGLIVDWQLETHIHADHLSAAPYLKHVLGGKIGVGAKIGSVQETWNKRFNLAGGLAGEPAQFDVLFGDGEAVPLGQVEGRVLDTPGHTAMDVTYVFGDAAFIGDTFFAPDYGVARTDFPGGDAHVLYRSLKRLLDLPAETRLFLCHDYLPASGRSAYQVETTIAEQAANAMLGARSEDEFVELRRGRDKDLTPPVLIFPALQINIRAGAHPEPEENGVAYLKIPLRKG